ncbi:hypothetical protein DV515_00013953 [Chloebia gouldiae]|uniref:Raptor N-terminal CASPase-like domain-containing protein n=1 Tax=Chloebia gouldiae TaxID=44316 RepID=A0A3L8S0M8_CHLGU|nr:hypothetical protein DV515_00013953 [Chloebia gouldiae]
MGGTCLRWEKEHAGHNKPLMKIQSDAALPLLPESHFRCLWDEFSAITSQQEHFDRMKTVSVALVLCLNVGVDPPDVVKTTPCARLECWIDPLSMGPQKALETIGANLQKQYENWQPRVMCIPTLPQHSLAGESWSPPWQSSCSFGLEPLTWGTPAVLGAAACGRASAAGNYTQYIPLSIYDLQTWMGSPSIFVYDCSNAGLIVKSFKQFALQREQELEVAAINPNHPLAQMPLPPSMKNCIQLAACEANELLPMIPDLPADLFTSCLTTPIKIALRWGSEIDAGKRSTGQPSPWDVGHGTASLQFQDPGV